MARVIMLYKIKHDLADVTPDPPLYSTWWVHNSQQLSQIAQKYVYQNSFFGNHPTTLWYCQT